MRLILPVLLLLSLSCQHANPTSPDIDDDIQDQAADADVRAALHIDEFEIGKASIGAKVFNNKFELKIYLNHLPPSQLEAGITLETHDKRYIADGIQDLITAFCKDRGIDMFMIVPTGKDPGSATGWVVKRRTKTTPK